MYLTSSEYATLTGQPASDATISRIYQACKMLDSRIGNYAVYDTGWKIDDSATTWYVNSLTEVMEDQKQAIKLWIANLITIFVTSGSMPSSAKSVTLGRFSVNKGGISGNSILSDEMGYVDSVLISSGIINRSVMLT